MSRIATGLVVFLVLSGCAVNSYQTHYSGTTVNSPDVVGRVVTASWPPQVSRGSNPREDMITMLEAGYLLLGSSSFTGSVPPQKALFEQAASVGASRVILYEHYQQTVSGTPSLTLPAGGGGGAESTVGYHGGATATSQGGSAVREIPYSVKQYAQLATFWARAKPPRVGIYYRPLNESERAASKGDGGVAVIAVVTDSPAAKANILRGDIILRANDTDVTNPQQLNSFLQGVSGSVSLEILRDSELHRITVTPRESK